MLDKIDITFNFEFGAINDQCMIVNIFVDSHDILLNGLDHTEIKLDSIKIPNTIKIKFSGKNSETDTILDSDGSVLKDKYVKITKIKIDQLSVPSWVIEKKLMLTTEDHRQIHTSYVGFNGEMIIDIPSSNVFSFFRHLTCVNPPVP
jgi:hypothetical protein